MIIFAKEIAMASWTYGSIPPDSGYRTKVFAFLVFICYFIPFFPDTALPLAIFCGMISGPLLGPASLLIGSYVNLTIGIPYPIGDYLYSIVWAAAASSFIIGLTTFKTSMDEGCGGWTFLGWILSIPVFFYLIPIANLMLGLRYDTVVTSFLWDYIAISWWIHITSSFLLFILGGFVRICIVPESSDEKGKRRARKQTPIVPIEVELQDTSLPAWGTMEIAAESRGVDSGPVEARVSVASGVDMAGEDLKIGIKIMNDSRLAITNVKVILDTPEGLEYTKESEATVKLGTISPGGSQSAIYWLRPLRCINDNYSGVVIYKDAKGETHKIKIPRKKIVNICPMLEGIESPRDIFSQCKYGGLLRNSASFKFAGSPSMVFSMASSRIVGLEPVDKTEQTIGEEGYLAYTCVVGKTKYGDKKFAAEIQVSGIPTGGVLTLNVYSDDETILSGFFMDIMPEVRQHVQILEENNKLKPTNCPNCNAPLDFSNIDDSRIYQCESCGSRGKVPPWLA